MISLMLTSCSKSDEEITVKSFTDYCGNFCEAVNMEQGTEIISENTLICNCKKIFLRKQWEESNG